MLWHLFCCLLAQIWKPVKAGPKTRFNLANDLILSHIYIYSQLLNNALSCSWSSNFSSSEMRLTTWARKTLFLPGNHIAVNLRILSPRQTILREEKMGSKLKCLMIVGKHWMRHWCSQKLEGSFREVQKGAQALNKLCSDVCPQAHYSDENSKAWNANVVKTCWWVQRSQSSYQLMK